MKNQLGQGEETLEKVYELIDSYERSIGSQDILGLINLRKRLSVQAARLGDILSDCKVAYNESYFNRKIYIEHKKQELVAKELPYNKASTQAMVESEGLYRKELDSQGFAYRMENLLKQINMIVTGLDIEISFLKNEKKFAE